MHGLKTRATTLFLTKSNRSLYDCSCPLASTAMKFCSTAIKLFLTICFVAPITLGDEEKPKIAVFPLGGDATPDMRERVGFSIRAKLDRDATYEPIDGPTMKDAVGDKQIDAKTDAKD